MTRRPTHQESRQICICGHPVSRHEMLGSHGHERCRMWLPGQFCECSNGDLRPVLEIHKSEVSAYHARRFQRSARGRERPHAVTGGVNHLRENEVPFTWLVTVCDWCHKNFGLVGPLFYALDEDGEIQRPHKPRTNGGTLSKDTGKHVMICAICDYNDQLATGYKEPEPGKR